MRGIYRGKKITGQGHTVTNTVMVARLLVPYSTYPYAAVLLAAVAGVGLHVDTTAYKITITSTLL